jgi:hypothetical protein
MNRRKLLSTAPAAVVLAGTDAAAAHAAQPDAKLVALCAEFEVLERKFIASLAKNNEEQDRADAICDAIYHEQAPIVAAITACCPTTLTGFTALANVAVMVNPMLVDVAQTDGDYSERLLQVMLRGMTGRAAA